MSEKKAKPEWGPKMAALPNDRWRWFVWHLLNGMPDSPVQGGRTKGYTQAAERAGFKGSRQTLNVTGHKLAHDCRIQDAIQEEARRQMIGSLPFAMQAIEEIAFDRNHKDRLAAAKTIADRAGLHEVTETRHTVEFIGNDPAMLERVRQLAKRLNIPVERLLGTNLARGLPAPTPELIVVEAEYEEVKTQAEKEPDSEIASPAGAPDETEQSDVQEEKGEQK